jgi:CheY-like chemotaxis protein
MTGYASPDDVRRAHDAGFDQHLAKPMKLEMLNAVLARQIASDAAPHAL